jgi:hypothetical protein
MIIPHAQKHYRAATMELVACMDEQHIEMHIVTQIGETVAVYCQGFDLQGSAVDQADATRMPRGTRPGAKDAALTYRAGRSRVTCPPAALRRLPLTSRPAEAGVRPRTIRVISAAMPSGDRTKSMHPLAMALAGISGCPAVSGFCAMVVPPASLMPQSAAAPSPS